MTLCDPMNCSPPGCSAHGVSQARILKWVAISFSGRASQLRDLTWVSCIGRQILYCWAIREAHYSIYYLSTCYFDFNFSFTTQNSKIKDNSLANNVQALPFTERLFQFVCKEKIEEEEKNKLEFVQISSRFYRSFK